MAKAFAPGDVVHFMNQYLVVYEGVDREMWITTKDGYRGRLTDGTAKTGNGKMAVKLDKSQTSEEIALKTIGYRNG
jgi:hypothetical protein